ncbi:MAG TPA: AMP-binding protein, partial [Methanocorpusculum sp.]|nr:AMP-binding protein [Methanocorpusculum sp.]
RKDWMVKINGQRVETLEIEQVLLSVEHIKDAAVKAFSDADSQTYLVGYYVSDAEISSDDIRIFLAEKLPAYMIPRYLVRLDAIPKNQNGKVDHGALLPPEISLYKTVYVAPSTPEEKALCNAFETILGCEKVGVHDDFFALGGDSIKVMKLLSDAPVEGLTVDTIVKGKTPEAIAYLCVQTKEEAYAVRETYPFTQTQLGIFADCAANPETAIYNVPSLYKLDAEVDIDKLKTAIVTAVDAHPYLKTVVTVSKDGEFLAKRNDTAEVNIRIIKCDALPDPQSLVHPFDILQFESPLYRIEIYQTKNGNYLFTDFHHNIYDGTSAAILLEDINQIYAGHPVEKEKYTGFDAALDEQKIRESSLYSEAKEYYRKLLGSSPVLSRIPYNTKKSTKAAVVSYISQLDTDFINTYCLENNITLNAFCNAVHSLVLAKYTNKRDILYSTVYNGRNNAHYIRSAAMLVKTLPVVSHIADYHTFPEMASALQTELQNSMAHDCYSFADIVSEYHTDINDGIAFVYQGNSRKQIEIAGKSAAVINILPDTAKTALSTEVYVQNNRFELICQYRAEQYDDILIQTFLADIERTMKEAVCSSSLLDISVLNEEYQTNITSVLYTDDENQNYINFFRKAVQQNADKPALIDFDGIRQTTYAELERLSSKVAGKLHALGCSKGDFIPILIERQMEYIAAYLGILKAGCVVVPLIPEFPKERISYITEHCDAKLTIDIKFFEDIEAYEAFEDLAGEDEPALLIYTSGSTGVPKGILHTNRSVLFAAERLKSLREGVNPFIFAAVAPLSFIVHVQEYLCIFLFGGCVHILSNTVIHSLPLLEEYYNKHSITCGYLTPKLIAIFTPPSSLQRIYTGGEALIDASISGNYSICNLYGQGETCSSVSSHVIEKACKNPSLGKGLPGIDIQILDETGKEVPHGTDGEICIKGNFGTEYFKSPETSAKTFIKTDDGKTLVHTGDVGYIDENGDLVYVNRKDWMVKINGQRVET